MKYLFSLLMMSLFICGSLLAQVKDSISINRDGIYVRDGRNSEVVIDRTGIHVRDLGDTVDINWNFKKKELKNVKTRWLLMDLGFEGLVNNNDKLLENGLDPFEISTGNSSNLNLHMFQQKFNLIQHHLNIKWGLSFEFHKYEFDNNIVLLEDQGQATFKYEDQVKYNKNRLSYTYLTLPIMFNIETKPKEKSKSFHINFGMYGGPRLGANFKTRVKGEGKDKVKDDFNLSRWRYGSRFELGYGMFTLYGSLAMNELFEKDHNGGYDITPFSLGVIILPF